MKRRIFCSILLTSMLLLAVAVSVVTATVYSECTAERKSELRSGAEYIADGYDFGGVDYLIKTASGSGSRITLVSPDGDVLYDSFADSDTMENHADRPEIAEALLKGKGETVRPSETFGEKTYYYAMSLSDGNVLRVASTMKSMLTVIDNTATYIALTVLAALVLAIVCSELLTRAIIAPINAIDPEKPLAAISYPELSPLIVRMDRQNRKISEQLKELTSKQREFVEITDGMNEAMVVFGIDRTVLSANRAARSLFAEAQPEGMGYLELCRALSYIKTVESAFNGESRTDTLEKRDRIYRLSADPVSNDGGYAAVLFVSDITESERSGQLRREFSANVSHELKTPLTSILGCAEIMTGGIAKPEDYPRFAGQIYDEAKRLLALVEDIIRLSRLDEGGLESEFLPSDLYGISSKVLSELIGKADKNGVTLSLEGTKTLISGVPNTLHEMIYNLCDNAITYNKPGGSVSVTVGTENGLPYVSVADTGIGIAEEHQSRIFERFYRVDKSHSKQTGGTGLGLSIVKHGAQLHKAKITLTSTPGEGTEIKITFPYQKNSVAYGGRH